MRMFVRSIVILFMALLLASCKKTLTQQELPAHIQLNDTYYTQFVIRYEKGRHRTTNYRIGPSVPINTAVTLLKITNKSIEVSLPSGQPLMIENVQKHTNDDVYQAFDKLFGKQKVSLSRFSSKERKNIASGTVAVGMSKKAVLRAIGYPPTTETPTLDANTWVYWTNRFNRFNVQFKNDRVSQIID